MNDSLNSLIEWCKKQVRERPVLSAVSAGVVVVGGLYTIGGYIITTGLISGLLLSLVFGILLYKARSSKIALLKKAYNSAIDHPLATDVALTITAFMLAPAGIVAWVAASVAGIMTSLYLLAEKGLKNEKLIEVAA